MRLVLIGAGGHCKSCIAAIRSIDLEPFGVLSPEPVSEVCGLPWLGDDSWLDSEEARDACFLITVGQIVVSPLRRQLFTALRARGLKAASIVAVSAEVATTARIGAGSIVLHRAVVNACATVDENCIINTGAIVEHDASIGAHCHISTGAIVNGGADVGAGCMIGSGAIIVQGVRIAAGTVVGAGAVVTANIEQPGTWVGVPARRMK
jgi:sugar O-acyltransferase (sialic acid O-acetyltransferase NeuD family)